MTIGIAFLLGAAIIVLAGRNPATAYYWMFRGAFFPSALPETLIRAAPLLLVSLGLAVAFTAKIWNIGAEGQLYIGGMLAAITGLMLKDLPAPLAMPLIFLVAGLGGAAWAFLPAFLRAKYEINEIITTLMLNYVAIYLVSYLLNNPFKDPLSQFPETQTLPEHLWAPILVPGTRLHLGVLIAFLFVPLVFLLLRRTGFGLKLEVLGANPKAAKYAGVPSALLIVQAMLVSGFLAGLAGGIEVLGVQHKMRLGISPPMSPYGFTGIAVALLGFLNPLLIALTSVFLGGVINGSMTMHRMAGIPVGMAGIIQALIIIFILASYFVEESLLQRVLRGWKR